MVGLHCHLLESYPSSPFDECYHYGIRFLFSGGPVELALGEFPTVEGHWYPFSLPLLLEDCSYGKVTGVGPEHKGLLWFQLEHLQSFAQGLLEGLKCLYAFLIPLDRFGGALISINLAYF